MKNHFQRVENDLFGTAPRASIPIKPISFQATPLSPENSGGRGVTSREATTLLIAAQASGCRLEPGNIAPRAFSVFDEEWIIGNGCGQDIVRSGLAEVRPGAAPRDDGFVLSARFVQWVETHARRGRLDAFMAAEPVRG